MSEHVRLESLDVFRGLTIAAMILVNTPGTWDAVYAPLEHAVWNGWTPTDLVFPFLLFAMGAAVPFAIARRREARRTVRRHVIRRGAILFALGLLLTAIETTPPLALATFRILGVLQRIAIVYVIVAVLTERTSVRTQAIVATAVLVGYWGLMRLVPVPGVGAGVLTPDGNLAAFIDRAVFGRHLAFGTWDSEGLLSTLPAVATALCGVFAGTWLTRHERMPHHTIRLAALGAGVALVGWTWGRVFPINKNLWTSSFALLTAGLATIALAACHWLLDVKDWRWWTPPFVAFGRNPLAGYFLSVGLDSVLTRWTTETGMSLKWLLYLRGFASWAEPCCGAEAASLAYSLAYVVLWALVLMAMRRRRIYIGI